MNDSVQLVTASQCAHWFNLTKFFSETERVLSPGGVLAIYGYSLPMCEKPYDEITKQIDQVCNFTKFVPKKRKYLAKFLSAFSQIFSFFQLMKVTLSDYMPKQSKALYLDQYKSKDYHSFLFNKEPVVR